MFSMTKIKVNSVVKGYHAYKVKPNIGSVCIVRREGDFGGNPSFAVISAENTVIGHVPAKPIKLNAAFVEILDLSKSLQFKW